jgi:type IV pilus assembly protein PilQ
MKQTTVIMAVCLIWLGAQDALGQAGLTPAERKGIAGYTPAQELVSIAASTPMDKALAAISEVSKKSVNKIIIDTERRTMPINVDIQGFQWRDALDVIVRKNGLEYAEYDTYIQIIGAEASAPQSGTTGPPQEAALGIPREVASFRSREIQISAVFFEANLTKLDEVGINWSFMKSTSDFAVDVAFQGADQVSSSIFKADVTPKISFANMNFVAKVFSDYKLGEILSGPQLIVRSGEQGRIQVGQDFSIRERDFAGNLIDKFYSAGTIITVTPQVIMEQGVFFVHMVVDVERSSVTPGQVSTIVNKTKASTNVLLLDGEETIIGGLYNNEVTNVRTGVPFLKDLPWYIFGLRYLFGYDKEQVDKKELVILLKAELVPTLQERIAQKPKAVDLVKKWKDGWRRGEAAARTLVDE